MAWAKNDTQAITGYELTSGRTLDRAFKLVRSIPAADLWPGYAFVVLGAGLLAGIAWMEVGRDSGAGWAAPELMRALSVGRLILAAAYVLLGISLARSAWELIRGPLDPGAPTWKIALGGIVLGPVIAILSFAPVGIGFRDELLAGETTLLSGEALQVGTLILLGLTPVVFLPFFLLAPFVVVVEGKTPLVAIRRSIRLALMGGLKAHGVFFLLLAIRLSLTVGLAAVFLGGVDAFFATDRDPARRRAAFGCAGLITEALLAPQLQLALMMAYLEVRVQDEGLDVERDGRACGLLKTGQTP